MGTYERKVNQLKDLMRRKYKSAYNKSKEMDIDISSMTYLPCPDAFNVINIEEQKTYTRRPSNKACPNYEYGDDNFENRKRCLKKKNTR